MLSLSEAIRIVYENLPGGTIKKQIEYQNLYLFQVFRSMPFEEEWDPFFSVDKETGEFSDFSIIDDGNMEIIELFRSAL